MPPGVPRLPPGAFCAVRTCQAESRTGERATSKGGSPVFRAAFGPARLEGEPSPGWSHLGCDHAGPSLPGAVDVRLDAWPRPRRAPGVDSTVGDRRYRAAAKRRPRSPGRRPFARLVAPWLRPRRAKPARAMDGRAGVKAGPHLGCDRAGPSLPGSVAVRLHAWPRPRRAPGVDSTVGDRRYRAAAKRRPRSPGGATARPAGRTLAATAPGQACRGHGWPGRREIHSPRSSRKFSRSATRLE